MCMALVSFSVFLFLLPNYGLEEDKSLTSIKLESAPFT